MSACVDAALRLLVSCSADQVMGLALVVINPVTQVPSAKHRLSLTRAAPIRENESDHVPRPWHGVWINGRITHCRSSMWESMRRDSPGVVVCHQKQARFPTLLHSVTT